MSTEIVLLIVGLVVGVLVAGGAALLVVKSRVSAARAEVEGEVREAKVRLEAKDAEIANLRSSYEAQVSELKSERQNALELANEKEQVARNSMATAVQSKTQADALVAQLQKLDDKLRLRDQEIAERDQKIRSLEVEITTERSRADNAERVRTQAMADKDAEVERLLQEKETSYVQKEKALREGFEHQVATLKKYVEDAQTNLKENFGSASTKALQTATEQFLDLAKKQFEQRDEQAGQAFQARKDEIEKLVEPIQKELGELEELNRQIEKERAESFGVLKQTIESLNKSSESLSNALKKPSVRGNWGEGQLRVILESSGLQEGRDYFAQDSTEEDGKTLRTDFVIKLPKGRTIIIDSKAPLDKYLAAVECSTEEEKERLCREHAKAVRGHVKDLQKKEYWTRYDGAPPYVILFLPYEAAYQIACEFDKDILNEANRARIILANPMTLMNLVHLAGYLLNEERLQHGAEEVRKLGQTLCQRLTKVVELMAKHGRHVRLVAESYNEVVASVDGRLLPSANRMRELGAGAEKSLQSPEQVDTAIRHIVVHEEPEAAPSHALVEDLDLE